jgi:hypothetical protein
MPSFYLYLRVATQVGMKALYEVPHNYENAGKAENQYNRVGNNKNQSLAF